MNVIAHLLRRPTFTVTPGPGGGPGFIDRLHGIDWYEAETPPHRHRCWAQTRGLFDGALVERCACGAFRYAGRPWLDRNTKRPLTDADRERILADRCAALRRQREAHPINPDLYWCRCDHPHPPGVAWCDLCEYPVRTAADLIHRKEETT